MDVRLVVVGVLMVAVGTLAQTDDENLAQEIADRRVRITCGARTSTDACQNFARNSINKINLQINRELNASYIYTSMGYYFARDDTAYRGVSKFFLKAADEERDHAHKFMNYLIKRGGKLHLKTVHAPAPTVQVSWGTPLAAFQVALQMERDITQHLLDLHDEAAGKDDPHLQDFLEGEFLTEQVDSIKQLSDYVTILSRYGDTNAVGVHVFDEELHEGKR